MSKHYITILLTAVLSAFANAAGISPESVKARFDSRRAESSEVRLDVNLTWNPETEYPHSITLLREEGSLTATLGDMPPEAKGFWIPIDSNQAGIYQIVMCFQKMDDLMYEGHRSFVITEDCDLTSSLEIDINAASADRLVSFVSRNSSGAETSVPTFMMGENGYEKIRDGNAVAVNLSNILVHDDKTFYHSGRMLMVDGIMEYPEEWNIPLKCSGLGIEDIYINEVSGRWKIIQCRSVFNADMESTDLVVLLASEFDESINLISNDPSGYYSLSPSFLTPEVSGDFRYPVSPGLATSDDALAYGLSLYMKSPAISVCIPDALADIPIDPDVTFSITADKNHDFGKVMTSERLIVDSSRPLHFYSRPVLSVLAMGEDMKSSYYNIPALDAPLTSETIIGATAPYAVVAMGRDYSSAARFRYRLDAAFAGSMGEVFNHETSTMKNHIKCDGNIILENSPLSEFADAFEAAAKPKGEYELYMISGRPMLNGDSRKTTVTSRWNYSSARADCTPPTLTYLQFKTNAGEVADEFDRPEDGMIFLTAGDFEPAVTLNAFEVEGTFLNYNYFRYNPAGLKLYYRPHGMSGFNDLSTETVSDCSNERGFGEFYKCNLSQVESGSETGWFDLRISLSDSAGNSQTQDIEKAFRIKSLAGVDNICDDSYEIRIEGNSILAPDHALIHTPSGIPSGPDNLAPGIYFVSVGGKTHKVMIP